MAKPLKSQWEFGELFPAEAVRKVLTVSEITGSIRRLLEKEIGRVSVMGELTNLRQQSSGHVYFTIKDANAQLSCVMFRAEAQLASRSVFQEGQKVVIEGEVTVYEARGQYQLRVITIQPQGVGALQAAFERLKQKLQTEGLFDQGHKRPLPRYPQRLGLVTSPVGAAIRDVLHAIERRNPALTIVLAPCRVQGPGAAQEIAAAIHLLNDWSRSGGGLDAILLTRGGGSLEDLWAFNEEIVARAVYASDIPIVSAVGHEIDFTISDFVADVRAATPTAAAEILTEGVFSVRAFLLELPGRMLDLSRSAIQGKTELLAHQLRHLARVHPRRRFQDFTLRIDQFENSLSRCLRHHFAQAQTRFVQAAQRLTRLRPALALQNRREKLASAETALQGGVHRRLEHFRQRLARAETRLNLLSPAHVLNRGYSITIDENTGTVVRDSEHVRPGGHLRTRLARGSIRSVVENATPAT